MESGLWALAGTIIGGIISLFVGRKLQGDLFKHEKTMHQLNHLDKENAKAILHNLLNHKSYTDRYFKTLRLRVGGFSDDELRRMLHELNAKRSKNSKTGEELWYLSEREVERIQKRTSK